MSSVTTMTEDTLTTL